MNDNILVTGASGFLGTHLMGLLTKRFPLSPIIGVALDFNVEFPRAKLFMADLLNKEETRGILRRFKPRYIFHLAGAPAYFDDKKLNDSYLQVTQILLDALKNSGTKMCRLVLPSSVTVYGHFGHKRNPILETYPTFPLTPYAKVKLAQEKLCLAAQSGPLKIVIGRIFNLTGPNCPPHIFTGAMAQQVALIEKNMASPKIKTGNLANIRDFIDIRDAASALIELAELGRPGEIYNVCTGRGTKLKDLLKKLVGLSESSTRIQIERDSSRVRRRAEDVAAAVGSPVKIKRDVRWQAKYSIEKSLLDTLNSYRIINWKGKMWPPL